MPFSSSAFTFDWATIATANQVGAVYGLFSRTFAGYVCKYVGKTDNLRRRLGEHLSNPPVAGITHWFAEVHTTDQQRTYRESALIAEFHPPGNTVGRR
jgi:hypothetical protein